jgi:hypothetical protein
VAKVVTKYDMAKETKMIHLPWCDGFLEVRLIYEELCRLALSDITGAGDDLSIQGKESSIIHNNVRISTATIRSVMCVLWLNARTSMNSLWTALYHLFLFYF